jgi:hypothetical protein
MNSYLVAFFAASFSALCAYLLIATVERLDSGDSHRH